MQLFRRDKKNDDEDDELERFYRNLQTVEQQQQQESEAAQPEESEATVESDESHSVNELIDPTFYSPPAYEPAEEEPEESTSVSSFSDYETQSEYQDEPRSGEQSFGYGEGLNEPDAIEPQREPVQPPAPAQPLPTPRPIEERTPEPVSSPAPAAREGSRVARGTSFSGTLSSDGNITIEGTFDGELQAKEMIYIDESAKVQADLNADEVVVAGQVTGSIRASRRFHALATAQIGGEVQCAHLVIDEGAEINCTFRMQDKEEHRIYE